MGENKALCFINRTVLCLNSIVLLRRRVDTCLCLYDVVAEVTAVRQVRSAGQQVTNSSAQAMEISLCWVSSIYLKTIHTSTHHPQQVTASWHREAMKNLVQIHLGGPGHIKIPSSPSCVAGQVPPGSARGAREAEASWSCRGPFGSFVPPIFSLPLPNP